MRAMGIFSPSPIQARLERMRDKGYVTWIEGVARTVKLIQVPKPGIAIKGNIAAGGLVSPFTHEQSTLELPHIFDPNSYYALQVEGDSLVQSAIADSDIAIIRRLTPEETVKNGEIVAVKVEGDGVRLSRYNVDSEQVTLTSLEKETSLKVPRTIVEIQGVVVGVWRDNSLNQIR